MSLHTSYPLRFLSACPRVLIANIKNMGTCLCPRCHVTIAEVQDIGTPIDTERRQDARRPTPAFFQMVARARKSVFKGFKVSGPHVDKMLGFLSRVPTVVSAANLNSHLGQGTD